MHGGCPGTARAVARDEFQPDGVSNANAAAVAGSDCRQRRQPHVDGGDRSVQPRPDTPRCVRHQCDEPVAVRRTRCPQEPGVAQAHGQRICDPSPDVDLLGPAVRASPPPARSLPRLPARRGGDRRTRRDRRLQGDAEPLHARLREATVAQGTAGDLCRVCRRPRRLRLVDVALPGLRPRLPAVLRCAPRRPERSRYRYAR